MVVGIQCFRENGILDGNVHGAEFFRLATGTVVIHVAVHGHVFIQSPTCRHVVDHNISDRVAADRVVAAAHPGFAAPETHVADDHVVGVDPYRFACDTNAVAGCGLAGNGYIGSTDNQRTYQPADSSHIEYDDTCAALFTCPAERSRAAVGQAGYDQHFP